MGCPYYNRTTGIYSEYGGHMYIKLGNRYYEEFNDDRVLGITNDRFSYETIYFEENFNPVYVNSGETNPINLGALKFGKQ